MAEIKSTIDLVMKKLGKLDISPEERARFKKEEVKDFAQRLLNRYFIQGDQKGFSTLTRELEGAREGVRDALVELLVSAYSFEDPSPTNLTGLMVVQEKKGREIAEVLQELTTRYRRERDEEWRSKEEDLRTELDRKGIAGSAVEPNPASDPRWGDFIEQLNRSYEERKKELLKTLV